MTRPGLAKNKVISSGRLTSRGQVLRKKFPSRPVEPAYSLYSTDSEDQVVTIHKGLDHCAAVLTGILQSEKAEAKRVAAAHPKPSKRTTLQTNQGVPSATVFNCRLTTSTPALSPDRAALAYSQPCASHCTQAHGLSGAQHHQFTQHWAVTGVAPSLQTGGVSPAQLMAHGAQCLSNPTSSVLPQQTTLSSSSDTPGSQMPQTPEQVQGFWCHPESIGSTLASSECYSENSEVEEVGTGDSMPISVTHTQTLPVKVKATSPEKTTRKVTTVNQLLEELKTLVSSKDNAAVQLIGEVEQIIALLPAVVGATNVQAEIALALQPLRSENTQLRRRLRILNQQLRERERVEWMARPVDSTLELASLQSLNLSLQTQLKETCKHLQETQLENQQLWQATRKKEQELQLSREQSEAESSRIRTDVGKALVEMKTCQRKLEDSERDNVALMLTLHQRESEISKLQDVIRNLQGSSGLDNLSKPDSQHSKETFGLYEDEQRDLSGCVSDSVRTSLQILESNYSPHKTSSPQYDPWNDEGTTGPTEKVWSPVRHAVDGSIISNMEQRRNFIPLRETIVGQMPCTQKLSPARGQSFEVSRESAVGQEGFTALSHALDEMYVSSRVPSQGTPHVRLDCDPATAIISQNARHHWDHGKSSSLVGWPSVTDTIFSSCDSQSLASDGSSNSWSTFNTCDEMNFRSGLAALDASIASLQRTLQADLKIMP
ncbi:coiled-coil domain-containing protein 14 isoform X2 [Denticeps clupeoides]|uniref:coiled-coil domain-containing protein 14 isoform X2 n=1 Tax=Denticeps clupeoides TaxID=299321 RepID=UPI0010A49C4B|nr:coiled-coil domain-containing protein 14 isoform X2 [Denticeps clupeoides]